MGLEVMAQKTMLLPTSEWLGQFNSIEEMRTQTEGITCSWVDNSTQTPGPICVIEVMAIICANNPAMITVYEGDLDPDIGINHCSQDPVPTLNYHIHSTSDDIALAHLWSIKFNAPQSSCDLAAVQVLMEDDVNWSFEQRAEDKKKKRKARSVSVSSVTGGGDHKKG